MKVYFRTDASTQIGSGHVMRCLTLAGLLKEQGVAIAFICRELPGNLCDYIEGKGYFVYHLPFIEQVDRANQKSLQHADWLGVDLETDLLQTKEIVEKDNQVDWLIVDHYSIDNRWEEGLRPYTGKLMVIDDLANRKHACDLLLDQNLYENMESRYDNMVPEDCVKLLGPKYALLRPEFSAARKSCKKRNGTVPRILISFGGSDQTNETVKALDAVRMLNKPDITIDVVVGGANPHREKIKELCSTLPNTYYHCQVNSMAALMMKADLAIGAGGSTTWERCSLGLPSIAWEVADNQMELLKALASHGAVYYPNIESLNSSESLSRHLFALINNRTLVKSIAKQGWNICDGRGTKRVSDVLLNRRLRLRHAEIRDCLPVYEWRNALEVRQYSTNKNEISWESHKKWFNVVLDRKDCCLLIGEDCAVPIGVLRFDFTETIAIISIYLAPDKFGKGYGRLLLEAGEDWLHRNYGDIRTIKAIVLDENNRSIDLFKSSGYKHTASILLKDI